MSLSGTDGTLIGFLVQSSHLELPIGAADPAELGLFRVLHQVAEYARQCVKALRVVIGDDNGGGDTCTRSSMTWRKREREEGRGRGRGRRRGGGR